MNWAIFFVVLALAESDGRPDVVGDRNLRHKAYGVYQIRQTLVDDVNRIAGKDFTLEEVVGNKTISRWYVRTYATHYATHYGQPLTYETAYRIHNGGPTGWRKESTLPKWRRYQLKACGAGLSLDVVRE